MDYRRLGQCGVKVSALCLGTMNFGSKVDETTALRLVHEAVDSGVNFIDTANVYGRGRSEEIVGKAIQGMREDLVLATKVRHRMGPGPNDEGLSRKHIMHEVEASLRRLNTEYIDIYYVHRPSNVDLQRGYFGEPIPMKETLSTLTELVSSGKVRYIGCSNFPAWLLCKALWMSDKYGFESYVVSQPRYNLFQREIEREVIPLCVDQGVGIVPYSPLAGGVLTGKYRAGSPPPRGSRGEAQLNWIMTHGFHWEDDNNLQTLEGLEALSTTLDLPMTQLALAWLLSNPAITSPIIGASNLQQLEENLASVDVRLSQANLDAINRVAPRMGPYYT